MFWLRWWPLLSTNFRSHLYYCSVVLRLQRIAKPSCRRRAEAVFCGGGRERQLGHDPVHELRHDREERGLQGDAVSGGTDDMPTAGTDPRREIFKKDNQRLSSDRAKINLQRGASSSSASSSNCRRHGRGSARAYRFLGRTPLHFGHLVLCLFERRLFLSRTSNLH